MSSIAVSASERELAIVCSVVAVTRELIVENESNRGLQNKKQLPRLSPEAGNCTDSLLAVITTH